MKQHSIFGETESGDPAAWAIFSEDQRCRFELGRVLAPEGPRMLFVMLNPSTATAEVSDPTITRCMGFARREKCGTLVVCNLSAWRATLPATLWAEYEQWQHTQYENLETIFQGMKTADMIVCAWGSHGGRAELVRQKVAIHAKACELGKPLLCLGTTNAGEPRHPLYIKADKKFEIWRMEKP